jgi:glycerate kinase
VIVCIGGSATNDGGAGMAQAVGVRLLDRDGRDVRRGGAALLDLDRIDATALAPEVAAARFVVASDVNNPLTGPEGASATYGPQKGASPDDVLLLDRALAHFAAVVFRDLGIDIRNVPGAGAAGGLGAGLIAFLGASLRPGIDVVMEAVRLEERMAGADAAVTGEGKFDAQSLRGKTPNGVIRTAEEAGARVAVLVGQAAAGPPEGVVLAALNRRFGMDRAMRDTRRALEELAAEVAAAWEET